MKFTLVQILVVVANIQVELLKTEVEKGFMRTAIDHELVDPKIKINLLKLGNCIFIKVGMMVTCCPLIFILLRIRKRNFL